jgi:hypothetical protein
MADEDEETLATAFVPSSGRGEGSEDTEEEKEIVYEEGLFVPTASHGSNVFDSEG